MGRGYEKLPSQDSLESHVLRVTHRQLEEILIHNFMGAKIAIFIWGGIGIGKSTTVKRVAEKLARITGRKFIEWNRTSVELKRNIISRPEKYFLFIDIRLSQCEPSDLRGLPSTASEFVEWRPPLWFYVLTLDGSSGILFLDELNHAPPLVQSAAFQLVLDRAVGDYAISDDIMVVAAGNRTEESTAVFRMSEALQNRFLHVELKPPSVDEWVEWALENDIDHRIIAFLRFKPILLYRPDHSGPAFPTPRSWEFASKLIKGVRDLEKVCRLVATAVGEGAAYEFRRFLEMASINVEEILNEPRKYLSLTNISVKHAVVCAMASFFEGHRDRDTLRKIIKVMKYMEPEFQALLLKQLKVVDRKMLEEEALSNDELKTLLRRLGRYMRGAAG